METTYIILLIGALLLIGVILYTTVGGSPAPPVDTTTATAAPPLPPADHVLVSNIANFAQNALVSSGTAADKVYQAVGLQPGSAITAANGFVLTNSITGVLNLTDNAGTLLYTVGTADNQPKTLTVSPSGQAVYGDTSALNVGATSANSYYLQLGADGTLAVWKTGDTTPMATIFTPSTTSLNNYQLTSSSLSFGPAGGDSLFQNGSLAPDASLSDAGGRGVTLVNHKGGDLELISGTYGSPWKLTSSDTGDKTYTITQYGELLRTSTTPGIYPTLLNPRMASGKYFLQVTSTMDPNTSAILSSLKILPFDGPTTSSNTYVFYTPPPPTADNNPLLADRLLDSGSSMKSPTSGFYRLDNTANGKLQLFQGTSTTPVWELDMKIGPMTLKVNTFGQIVLKSTSSEERLNRASSNPGTFSLVLTDDGMIKVVDALRAGSTFFQLYPQPSTNSTLGPGQLLYAGQRLSNNTYTLENQWDGNIVLYGEGHKSIWGYGTGDKVPRYVSMTDDGQVRISGNGVADKFLGDKYAGVRDYLLELTYLGKLQIIDSAGNSIKTIAN